MPTRQQLLILETLEKEQNLISDSLFNFYKGQVNLTFCKQTKQK